MEIRRPTAMIMNILSENNLIMVPLIELLCCRKNLDGYMDGLGLASVQVPLIDLAKDNGQKEIKLRKFIVFLD
jgi:hypothetical protein